MVTVLVVLLVSEALRRSRRIIRLLTRRKTPHQLGTFGELRWNPRLGDEEQLTQMESLLLEGAMKLTSGKFKGYVYRPAEPTVPTGRR